MKYLNILLILIFFSGCGQNNVKPTVNFSIQASKLPAQESWSDTVFFSDSAKIKAVLYAGHMSVYDEPPQTLLDSNITVLFYNPQGEKTTTLTALKGKVNDITKDLYAIDSVVAVSDSGVTLKTQELEWKNKERKITSDKFVTIISPKEKIQGYGFESDQSLRNYTIHNITYITRLDTVKQESNKKRKK